VPRTKPKSPPPGQNGGGEVTGDVLTLAEAAAYLRLPESEVLRLVREQDLPARQAGSEWRFLKGAIQRWLSEPPRRYSKEAQQAVAGLLKDVPDLVPMVAEICKIPGLRVENWAD
jgi:excisionase family DNA binding protein